MDHEKQEALEAVRKLAVYYWTFLNEETEYTSDGSLIHPDKSLHDTGLSRLRKERISSAKGDTRSFDGLGRGA